MVRALLVARKEVISYLQDRADLAFSLLLPIVIFGMMFGAFSGESLFNGTASIVNNDPAGDYSELLLERLAEREDLEVDLITAAEAEKKLERSDVLLVAYIPEDFSTSLADGRETQITFRQRGNGGQEGQIVASIIRGTADRLSQELQIERQVKRTLSGLAIGTDQIDTTVQGLLEREKEQPLIEVTENVIGKDIDPVDEFLPGIVTMFVLFAITIGSRTIVEERDNGTLERLMTTRLSVTQLFVGKFLSGTARGFAQTLILLTLAYVVFRMFTPLSFFAVLFVSVIFAAAASALGLVIASASRTADQSNWISVFFTMATVMLGGTFFEISPGSPVYILSRLSLNTYANSAFKTLITSGGNLGDIRDALLIMVVVVVAGLVLSRILFRVVPGGK
jgi:ABC-2 type transport system permease protein